MEGFEGVHGGRRVATSTAGTAMAVLLLEVVRPKYMLGRITFGGIFLF